MKRTPRSTHTKSRSAKRRTADALRVLDRITGSDRRLRSMIDDARVNSQVAEMIYRARVRAGLTQAELAEQIGTRQPVIARLEDADYEGHSLTMLQRIATALGRQLEVRFKSGGKLQRA